MKRSYAIDNSRFWGCEHAVADPHATDTHYRRCQFWGSVAAEIIFAGGPHSIEDSIIVADGPQAFDVFWIKPNDYAMGEINAAGKQPMQPPNVTLRNCSIRSADQRPRTLRIQADATVTLQRCKLTHIDIECEATAKSKTPLAMQIPGKGNRMEM